MRQLVSVLAFVALILPIAAAAQDQAVPDTPKPVKLMELSSRPVVQRRQFFGQVTARQTVDLAFQVGGSSRSSKPKKARPSRKASWSRNWIYPATSGPWRRRR
ncbi:hypothetical protein KU6B_13330 [Mameliella alba]|uniref:hypothetical protein n=1 Tax=Mameliella alba TaxID=561184 RepID=UPI0013E4C007|nr:hypothetical protein [Mameliella alba]BBU55068.1 hypothetical protein KU6B_13330 [Mameliella alba]